MKHKLVIAYNKGYRIDKEGNAVSPLGKTLAKKLRGGNNFNYYAFSFKDDGRYVNINIHRLQGYQKFGEEVFEEGIQIRHLNGNRFDNSWDNIGIGTQSENQMDIPKEIRIKRSSNPKHNHKAIIEDWKKGIRYPDLMKKHNISSKGTLSYIINKSKAL